MPDRLHRMVIEVVVDSVCVVTGAVMLIAGVVADDPWLIGFGVALAYIAPTRFLALIRPRIVSTRRHR